MPPRSRFDFKQALDNVRALLDGRLAALDDRFPLSHRFIHFWALVWRSFVRNRCPVRASALSYTTLLSLIPLLAVMLGITGVFLRSEGEQRISQFIERFVMSVVPPATSTNTAPEVTAPTDAPAVTNAAAGRADASATNAPATTNAAAAPNKLSAFADLARSKFAELAHNETGADARKEVARYINEFIQNTRSGSLGATGMVLLLWLVYALLSRIEETMNDIWGAPRGRNWLARVLNYWAAITLGPVLLVFGVVLASGPRSDVVRHFIQSMPFVGGLVFNVTPLLLLWLAFTLFYQLIPNTKVRFNAAAIGGLVGGVMWLGTNLLGSLYVSRVVTNSKIYGSLGLVPVFMVGLYTSWFILLLGAQVAYAWQNRAAYLQERLAENVNQRGREFVALRLMTAIGQRFQRGEKPATVSAMATELGIPSRLIQQVMQPLLATKLVVEVGGADGGYAPARPLETITAHDLLQALRSSSGQELATRDEPVRAEVYGEFARIQEAEKQAAASVTMLALVHRAQARLELAPPKETAALEPVTLLPGPETAEAKRPSESPFAPEPEPAEALVDTGSEARPAPAPATPPAQPPAEPEPPPQVTKPPRSEEPAPKPPPFVPDDSPFPD